MPDALSDCWYERPWATRLSCTPAFVTFSRSLSRLFKLRDRVSIILTLLSDRRLDKTYSARKEFT